MKMEFKIIAIALAAMALLAYGCSKFEYSNYQVNLEEHFKNTNAKNIDRLSKIAKDTITIAVIGDSQRFYDSTGEIIKKINATPNIDFVAHTGDLVDFGMQQEFIWMHKALAKLSYPYMAVVGNHDLIANGGNVYKHMYGDFNFSFTYCGNKFIFINTNSREFNFNTQVPDIQWLDKQLADTAHYKNAIVVSHVSHPNEDFNAALKDEFVATLNKYKKVMLSINGHYHNFSFTPATADGVAFLNTYSTKKEKFILLKIWGQEFDFEIIE